MAPIALQPVRSHGSKAFWPRAAGAVWAFIEASVHRDEVRACPILTGCVLTSTDDTAKCVMTLPVLQFLLSVVFGVLVLIIQ